MEKEFDVDDIRKLYDAFISLCDYVEENSGCGKCPMWTDMCGNPDKAKVNGFSDSLAKIRKIAEIPDPQEK